MATEYKKLYRSVDDRMFAGVCAGIADYFDIDPTLVRLLFALGFFVTGTGLFWIYLIMMVIVPEYVPASQDVITSDVEDLPSDK
jgi:phage shock protein C